MCFLLLVLAYFLFLLFLSTLFFPMPVNDSEIVRYRTVPWATLFLIIFNTVIFVLWIAPDLYVQTDDGMLYASEAYVTKIYTYGYTESLIRAKAGVGAFSALSSMFMHADFWHLFSNMLYLWTFGRRVEDACGSWRYLTFYMICGLLADIGSVVMTPGVSDVPSIGASGAIAGVMGAYMLLFPGSKVLCLWGIGSIVRLPIAVIRTLAGNQEIKIWRWTVTLRAWILLIWFLIQSTLPSLEIIMNQEELVGVNHLAHLAGFLAALTVFFYVRKDLLLRYLSGRAL
jgi:membrane associated rhomboid family serine protease